MLVHCKASTNGIRNGQQQQPTVSLLVASRIACLSYKSFHYLADTEMQTKKKLDLTNNLKEEKLSSFCFKESSKTILRNKAKRMHPVGRAGISN